MMRELGELFERLVAQLRDHPMRGALIALLMILALGYAMSALGSQIGAVRGPQQSKVTLELADGAAAGQDRAKGQSFSCADAKRWRELFVCSTGGRQIELDLSLSGAYHRLARKADAEGDKRLLETQSAWLARAEQCKKMPDPAACLIALTEGRIAELEAQAGVLEGR